MFAICHDRYLKCRWSYYNDLKTKTYAGKKKNNNKKTYVHK